MNKIVKTISAILAGGIMIVSSIVSFIKNKNEDRRNDQMNNQQGYYQQTNDNSQTYNYNPEDDPQSRRYRYRPENMGYMNQNNNLNNPTSDVCSRNCQNSNMNYPYGYADNTNTYQQQNVIQNSPYPYGYADNSYNSYGYNYNEPTYYSKENINIPGMNNKTYYNKYNMSDLVNKDNHRSVTKTHREIAEKFREIFSQNEISDPEIEAEHEAMRNSEDNGIVPMFIIPPEYMDSENKNHERSA